MLLSILDPETLCTILTKINNMGENVLHLRLHGYVQPSYISSALGCIRKLVKYESCNSLLTAFHHEI